MIICMMGWPGGGKSYDAMCKVLDNIQMGRNVYTNIDGCDDKTCQEMHKTLTGLSDLDYQTTFHFLTDEQVFHFWDFVKPGSLIVIDEIHEYFSNRDWDTQKNKDFVKWAATHRHSGFDLVMLTQHVEKVDKHVRSCVEWTYEYRKINFLGSFVKNRYLVYAFQGDSSETRCISKRTKTYKRNIFGAYKSYVTIDMKEQGFMKHVNILKHPVFFAIPIVLVFAIYMLFHSSLATGDLFGTKANLKRHEASIATGAGTNSRVLPSSVSNPHFRSKVIQYRDLPKKTVLPTENEKELIQVAINVSPPVVCSGTQTIIDGEDTITIEHCSDGTWQKKRNGVVFYTHQRHDSISSGMFASTGKHKTGPVSEYKKN